MSLDPTLIPDSYEDLIKRFQDLQAEADAYGIAAVTVLLDDDMIAREESKVVLWTRGHMRSVGMLEYGKHLLLTGKAEPRT